MMEYYFDLLGLDMVLKTPHHIQISERLLPFMQDCPGKADCTIELSYGSLPEPEKPGYRHSFCFYEDSGLRFFHSEIPGAPAYAMTEFLANGDIRLVAKPEYAFYFTGTSGILNRIGFENLLLHHHSVLLHASLIKYAGQGIAFTGTSGVGKSTQADLWHRCLGADILNGDRAALRLTDQGWIAYGSPFAGTSNIYRNDHTPLRAVVVLEQGKENHLERLNGALAMKYIWPEISARRWDRNFTEPASALCAQLINQIPVYLLRCLPNEDAVTLLKEGLSL